METEELTRLVDGIYKNILDKFNPGARQLINAGKAYLKALHGAAAASRVYVDALSRLARQAQLGTWGGSQDVGSTLMRIVEVYKEIQEQEMNILKAFYVDLLVPLETNLEKDTKVVQSEQKKFLQQHKTRSETYSKAVTSMKKQRKKSRGTNKSGLAMDKELRNMQILEEEKSKLDAFCEQSLKNAMTQERRRYGFVLERQCSLAKHYASFHEVALAALHPSVDEWREVAATREYLPQSVEDMFASRLRQVSFWPEDEENGGSELTMSSQLRKTRSMDSSCLELRLGSAAGNATTTNSQQNMPSSVPSVLSRARSEVNLHASSLSLGPDVPETPPRPRSMAPASRNSGGTTMSSSGWGDAPLARALFAYLSSGENQLSFLEGDLIALMGDRQKGWQFGENLRTQSTGWFPLAYTEVVSDETPGSPNGTMNNGQSSDRANPPCKPPSSRPPMPNGEEVPSGASSNNGTNNSNTPVNVPKSSSSHSITTPTNRSSKGIRSSGTLPTVLASGRRVQPPVPPVPPPQAVTSLHSSNDSGFSNEPPVQPDIDYSDDEAMRRRRKPRAERIAEAERTSKQQNQQQQKQSNRDSKSKDWKNDSWKTIPNDDDKSWQGYRAAMDLWPEDNQKGEANGRYRKSNGNQDAREYSTDNSEKRRSKNEYRSTGNGSKRSSRSTNNSEESSREEYRKRNQEHRRETSSKKGQQAEESEDEEVYDETISYSDRYERKKYYENSSEEKDEKSRRDYDGQMRYEDEKSSSSSSCSNSDDESTITIPETGRKVEHIAQKLEQTAQKYAREHSPQKFMDRRGEYKMERTQEEKQQQQSVDYKYEREKNRCSDQERYYEKSPSRHSTLTYERDRNLDKNSGRSSRRFERPRPPSQEAPERPKEQSHNRGYSDKEEIYGETQPKVNRSINVDRDRGYESNFETKLERTKIIERHGYSATKQDKNRFNSLDINDTNNNTLNSERKPLAPRQTMNSSEFLVQNGRFLEFDSKSPKLVKRTKSFWRFRRDSEVLEGMALWQHRSLVDIPKMISKEQKNSRGEKDEFGKSSSEGSPERQERRSSSTSTLTNEQQIDEPKPAERSHVPERNYFEDMPTPAERPKVSDRSEHQSRERPYFVGNVSRKAIIENERKRSLQAKRNMIVAELKENNQVKRNERRRKNYGDDDDGLIQSFTETEASDEESTYSCIVVKDQAISEKTLLPRTKLRRDGGRESRERETELVRDKNTCGPWYDLWGVDSSVVKKKKKN